jgi:hypothetical protein
MNHELTPVLKSWQFFLSCRRILGETFLNTLYNRSQRQIYRWCADPDLTSGGAERNPLDRMKTLFERLHERGSTDVALSALSYLSAAVGCEVHPIHPILPDKSTVEAEMLDDYPTICRFHEAIRSSEPDEAIRHWCMEAKRELDETLCKSLKGYSEVMHD